MGSAEIEIGFKSSRGTIAIGDCTNWPLPSLIIITLLEHLCERICKEFEFLVRCSSYYLWLGSVVNESSTSEWQCGGGEQWGEKMRKV